MKWLQRLAAAVVLGLAAYGVLQLWPEPESAADVYYPTDFSQRPYGVVGFPSFNAKASAQSFVDLWQFLRRTWRLDGPEFPLD